MKIFSSLSTKLVLIRYHELPAYFRSSCSDWSGITGEGGSTTSSMSGSCISVAERISRLYYSVSQNKLDVCELRQTLVCNITEFLPIAGNLKFDFSSFAE